MAGNALCGILLSARAAATTCFVRLLQWLPQLLKRYGDAVERPVIGRNEVETPAYARRPGLSPEKGQRTFPHAPAGIEAAPCSGREPCGWCDAEVQIKAQCAHFVAIQGAHVKTISIASSFQRLERESRHVGRAPEILDSVRG